MKKIFANIAINVYFCKMKHKKLHKYKINIAKWESLVLQKDGVI